MKPSASTSTIGAASGTPGSVPRASHSRAPAQPSTPATTNSPTSTRKRSCFKKVSSP